MRELSLFSGAGGGLLASHLLGWTPVGYVEYNDYAQRVIAARIRDGILANAPIYGDIRTFIADGYAASYKGLVDVVSGGFPCQPFSVAGKQAGKDDPRNMWPATISVVREVEPRYCFFENVPGLLSATYNCCGKCGCWDFVNIENDGQTVVVCENCQSALVKSAANTFWYFGDILRDLAESGYDARWRILSAAELGGPHKRDRLWIVAHANKRRPQI